MNDSSKAGPTPRRKAGRGKRLLQNLALSAMTFLLCAAAFEVILRLSGYGNLELYEADPQLYWKLKPDQDCYTKIGRKPVHINSHGTRGPDFQIEKPPHTFRILSLGDSRTFGWGLDDEETYSRSLEHLLQKSAGQSQHVQVINAGVNAWSYPQMWVFFREVGLKYKPDMVLLAGANLWTQFSEQSSREFVRKFMWRVRLKNFLRRFAIYHYVVEVKLREFYERQRTKFIPVDPKQDPLFKEQQQADPAALFRGSISNLCRLARSNGIEPILLYLPNANELGATNTTVLDAMQSVHATLNVPLVDMTPKVRPAGKALYLDADPVHFNARGNKLIAEHVFETITNLATP